MVACLLRFAFESGTCGANAQLKMTTGTFIHSSFCVLMELGLLVTGNYKNELVRVRLLAFVCRLCGLAWPLAVGSDAQANESVPPPFVNGGHECDQKPEAVSGATFHHQSLYAVGDNALTPHLP